MSILTGTNFSKRVSKKKYKKQIAVLKEQLVCLQKAAWDASLPVIILIEGWETVPKGGLIRSLTEPLDPRGFVFHVIRSPLAHEKSRPWMWRFWLKIPEHGQWAIFDQSWYRRVLRERNQEKIGERALRRALRDINDFERTLSDNGTLILKFFLHSEKAAFKSSASLTTHQTDARSDSAVESKTLARRYEQLHELFEDALRHTQTDNAPWIVIPSTDKRTARYLFLKAIVKTLQQRLGISCEPKQSKAKPTRVNKKIRELEDSQLQTVPIPTLVDSSEQLAAANEDQDPEQSSASKNAAQSDPEIQGLTSTATQTSSPNDLETQDDNAPGAETTNIP